MMSRHSAPGRPLVAVVAVLFVWAAIRASVWESPIPVYFPEKLFAESSHQPVDRNTTSNAFAAAEVVPRGGVHPIAPLRLPLTGIAGQLREEGPRRQTANSQRVALEQLRRFERSASHHRLYAAAFAYPAGAFAVQGDPFGGGGAAPGRARRLLAFTGLAAPTPGPQIVGRLSASQKPRPDRWSADAWFLLREGGGATRLSSAASASYGGDQVGAVLRYALAPRSAIAPRVYTRASKALVATGEIEAATGVSVALTRAIPVRMHGEVRVTDRPGNTEIRPAAFVVTGLPPTEIAREVEAEAYLQAGYVGGEFATGFVDGKASLQASVLGAQRRRIAVGAGAWGGAQRDAARVDLGPTASATLSTGTAALRASLDYRFRVAGDAVPSDGVALTLAASF